MSTMTERDAAALQVQPLAERWWVPVVRGSAAILFGLWTLVLVYGLATLMPMPTGTRVLVLVWGGYAMVDGVFNLVAAFRGVRVGQRWGWFFAEAIISLLVAAIAFSWPAMMPVTILGLIATWAVLTGLCEVAAAIRLRRFLPGEWLLAASGVLSIVLGLVLLMFPRPGMVTILWMIAIYAFAFGGLLIGLGMRLQRWARSAPLPRNLRTSA